jgi:hypothetical protein
MGFFTATKLGLQFGIQGDPAKQKAMANLLQYIAAQGNAFLSATGDNSPDALAEYINNNVPADIKTQYPELITFAVPLLVSGYQSAYAKWGNNITKLVPWMKDACAGISMGAGTYTTH